MSSGLKKGLNRVGLIGIAAGVVVFALAGGDVSAAADLVNQVWGIVGAVTTVVGTVLVFIREILN